VSFSLGDGLRLGSLADASDAAQSAFQTPTTTTDNLLGARQVQFGARLTF
jgi:thiamine biosynthesis protein ThiC